MSSNLNFPSVALSDIFEDLGAGSQAGVTVLTPNRRLARALKSEFDGSQALSGAAVWGSADILPISAFVERMYSDALYSKEAHALSALLAPAQEQVLWENAINCSGMGRELLDVGEAARLAREAWQLAHAWHLIPRLSRFLLNDDARAFREWSRHYEEAARHAGRIDKARLSGLILELLPCREISKPKRLVCYGFDIVTPQQTALLIKLKEAGCDVVMAQPRPRLKAGIRNARRVAYDNNIDEIRHAAIWARARLESAGLARIGIVVPDLAAHRSAILRIFSSIMEPNVQQPLRQPGRQLPFNISLGKPLISYPLVNAGLVLLGLAEGTIEFEHVSLLLRSPYLIVAEARLKWRSVPGWICGCVSAQRRPLRLIGYWL